MIKTDIEKSDFISIRNGFFLAMIGVMLILILVMIQIGTIHEEHGIELKTPDCDGF